MSEQQKMADVFDNYVTDQDGIFFGPQIGTNYYKIFMPKINAACHAINTHDLLVSENNRLNKLNIAQSESFKIDYFEIEKENVELRQANADKFAQIEPLKKQVNDLQRERDELLARNTHIIKILERDNFKRPKWIYTGTDAMFRDPESHNQLSETQSAAQRILDKDNNDLISGWISVDDRLPQNDGRYAVIVHNPNIPDQPHWTECTDYLCGIWLKMFHCKVTDWMPLPESTK